ncbi:hypothetical protein [Corynebacterium alimapuense]|uniref:Lipoprotein LpqE n=1 Tax=Corynebacterium alimapuense TaxID=1576874 RepID=A0A3M8KBV8_9CORY|nr:hypothetical protein [Corynebacterium alimapuense]RNE49868.1 hypothetical protein C5L39_00380 [Corynebacterium alimapuense]
MEDTPVKSLKATARRGGIISAAALCTLALASCSAGQVTQTSSQVAPVNGASADSADGNVAVRDVIVRVYESGEAALKFTAINQDVSMDSIVLESIEVNGTPVSLDPAPSPLERNCVLVGASTEELDSFPQAEDSGCIEYVETSLDNDDFAIGGNLPVVFTFNSGTLELDAAVGASQLPSGSYERMPDSEHDHDH